MSYTLKVVFGKEQIIKTYNEQQLTEEENLHFVREYVFVTLEEKLAFIKGMNEAIGWLDFCIPELEI